MNWLTDEYLPKERTPVSTKWYKILFTLLVIFIFGLLIKCSLLERSNRSLEYKVELQSLVITKLVIKDAYNRLWKIEKSKMMQCNTKAKEKAVLLRNKLKRLSLKNKRIKVI